MSRKPTNEELEQRVKELEEEAAESKLTEEALRASEERFRLTLDATSDGVWDYNLVTGETYYGKNWAKILGYTAEDLKNPSLSWKSLLHPDDKARALAAVKDNLSGRTEQYKAEFRLRNKAGEWQWILSRGRVVAWDENDQPIRFVGTHKEISDRKRAEAALTESEEKHRALFENANDAIFIVNPVNLTFIDANENAINRLGYSRAELLRLTINDIAGSKSVRRNEAKVRELMEKGGIIFEHTLRHKDGREIPVEISSKVIDYGDRKVIQAFVRDITERKQAREELKKSSEKMQLFAYSVAHDLKNPSIAIYGLTKRLQEKHGDSLTGKGKIYCEQIQKSAEQIAALVETINQYIATKEKPLQLEDINPLEVFQIIKEEFAARLNIRQISLFVPSNVPEIKADKLSILRVFRNFVDNALKYGGETLSKIEISYQDTDDSHIFSVSDDGIGLNKEDSRGIFGLFKRKETSRGIEGTGLGLAIVKEIAEHHQGEVWSKSGFRKGITFYLSISKHL